MVFFFPHGSKQLFKSIKTQTDLGHSNWVQTDYKRSKIKSHASFVDIDLNHVG